MNDMPSKYCDALHVASVTALLAAVDVLLVFTVETLLVTVAFSTISISIDNCPDSIGVISCG